MGYFQHQSRSAGELRSIAYRLCLCTIVPVAAILPACGGTHESGYPCPDVEFAGPTLIYPIPDASDVPTTPSDLIFSRPVANDGTTSLVPISTTSGATTLSLGAFVVAPSPIPSPAASYAPSTKLYAVAYPALVPNTQYAIEFGTPASGPCPLQVGSSGSFTTAKEQ
jgi:hypothetical protein